MKVGPHSLTVSYGGDGQNGSVTSAVLNLNVAKITPSLALASSASTPAFGTPITLTASLSGGANPTGQVTFKDGDTPLGSVPLNAGKAGLTLAAPAVGAHSYTVTYEGDGDNAGLTTAPVIVGVGQAPTGLSLTLSSPKITTGQAITLTATLSGGSKAAGQVTFLEGQTVLGTAPLNAGTASLVVKTLAVGAHNLSARYEGDMNNIASTAPNTSLNVVAATPRLSLALSSTRLQLGLPVTLTATLSEAVAPGGSVTFKDGATVLGTAPITNQSASLTTTALGVGQHSLTATYSGDPNNVATEAPVNPIAITQAETGLTLTSSATTNPHNREITFNVVLTGGMNPTGLVVFRDGNKVMGREPLTLSQPIPNGDAISPQADVPSQRRHGATHKTSGLELGTHTITATYEGDANNQGTTSSVVTVTINKAAPRLVLNSSVAKPMFGTAVTLSASLTDGSTPTGAITFKDGDKVLGSAPLSQQKASLTLSTLETGLHQITATYSGDASNLPMVSEILKLEVMARPNPGQDPGVRAMTTSQVATANRFAQTQISNVANHLESLHASLEQEEALSAGPGASSTLARRASRERSASSADLGLAMGTNTPLAKSLESRPFSPRDQGLEKMYQAGSLLLDAPKRSVPWEVSPYGLSGNGSAYGDGNDPSGLNPAMGLGGQTPPSDTNLLRAAQVLTQALGQSFSQGLGLEQGRGINPRAGLNGQAREDRSNTGLRVWNAGHIEIGKLKSDGQIDSRFSTGGLTLGVDQILSKHMVVGLALGYAQDHSSLDKNGSRSDTTAYTASVYGSLKLAPQTFVDVIGGYGRLRFKDRRWSTDGQAMLYSTHEGDQIFGSVGLTSLYRLKDLQGSLYGRVEAVQLRLDAHDEGGSELWALRYDRLRTTTVTGAAGLAIKTRLRQSWGYWQPGLRLEYRHQLDGGFTQRLGYLDIGSLDYSLTSDGLRRDTLTGGISLRAITRSDLQFELEYLTNTDFQNSNSQQLRAQIRIPY